MRGEAAPGARGACLQHCVALDLALILRVLLSRRRQKSPAPVGQRAAGQTGLQVVGPYVPPQRRRHLRAASVRHAHELRE